MQRRSASQHPDEGEAARRPWRRTGARGSEGSGTRGSEAGSARGGPAASTRSSEAASSSGGGAGGTRGSGAEGPTELGQALLLLDREAVCTGYVVHELPWNAILITQVVDDRSAEVFTIPSTNQKDDFSVYLAPGRGDPERRRHAIFHRASVATEVEGLAHYAADDEAVAEGRDFDLSIAEIRFKGSISGLLRLTVGICTVKAEPAGDEYEMLAEQVVSHAVQVLVVFSDGLPDGTAGNASLIAGEFGEILADQGLELKELANIASDRTVASYQVVGTGVDGLPRTRCGRFLGMPNVAALRVGVMGRTGAAMVERAAKRRHRQHS